MARRTCKPATKLGHFVVKRGISIPILSDFARCSRRYVHFMCFDSKANPSLKFVNRVTVACRLLTNERLRASQLFEIEE